MNTFERIYEVVRSIPKGKVATYRQVAMLAGNPRWARVVGYALHNNPDPQTPLPQSTKLKSRVSPNYAFDSSEV